MSANVKIEPYAYNCVVKDGPMAGNGVHTEVTMYDILYEQKCDNCGAELAPLRDIVAHMYYELVNQ
jgi:hypothetical protein